MIAGIVLGSLALLCVLALCQRVWIEIIWGPAGRSIDVRYLLIHFRTPRERRKRKKKQGRRKTGALGWIKLAPELLQAIGKGLKFLLRHSELRHLRLEGVIGTEDFATTGILWGTIQAVYGMLQPWGSKFELAVTPDFDEGNTRLTFDAEGAVRLVALSVTVSIILWYLPKRKIWQLLREQRRRQKKASHRTRQKEVKTT